MLHLLVCQQPLHEVRGDGGGGHGDQARTAGDQRCARGGSQTTTAAAVLGGASAVAAAECCLMSVGSTLGTTLGATLHCSALLLATGTLGHIMGPHRGTSGSILTMGRLDKYHQDDDIKGQF